MTQSRRSAAQKIQVKRPLTALSWRSLDERVDMTAHFPSDVPCADHEAAKAEFPDVSPLAHLGQNRCVYRKPILGHSGDEVRQGSRVNL